LLALRRRGIPSGCEKADKRLEALALQKDTMMNKEKDIRRIVGITMESLPGDIPGNTRKIIRHLRQAADLKAELVIFPELCLTGNLPTAHELAVPSDGPALAKLAEVSGDLHLAASVGYFEDDGQGRRYVAQAFLHKGRIQSVYRKIFANERGASKGQAFETVDWRGAPIATIICNDLHFPLVAREHAKRGALMILHPSAYRPDPRQPFDIENHNVYLPRARAKENNVFFFHVNASGCPVDGRYFFGNAIAVAPDGRILARIDRNPFRENLMVVDIDLNEARSGKAREKLAQEADRIGRLDAVPLPEE